MTLAKYVTASDTRSLSVASIASPNSKPANVGLMNSTSNSALLCYENSTSQVSALLERITQNGTGYYTQYFDITSQQSDSLPNEFHNQADSKASKTLYEIDIDVTLSAPFASGSLNTSSVYAVFYTPPNTLGSSRPGPSGGFWEETLCELDPSGSANFASTLWAFSIPRSQFFDLLTFTEHGDPGDRQYPIQNPPLQSDVALFGSGIAMWVDGTRAVVTQNVGAPKTTFPFARLASTTLSDGTLTLLYHQMNGTTIAEELWSDWEWVSTEYITISDP